MPSFNDPVADADEFREAVRGLAHATRAIEDPTAIYPVLGISRSALASLSQSLHQLGDFHDGPTRKQAWMNGDPNTGRAASYKVSWELHRAAEMVHQVAEASTGRTRSRRPSPTTSPTTRRLPRFRSRRRIPGCRCDRLAGRPDSIRRPRLPRARARGDRKLRKAAARARVAEDREARRTEAKRKADALTAEKRSTVTLPRAGEPGPAALRTPGRFRLPRHQDTSATLAGAYPFLAEGGLGSEGVFVGQDLYSGSSFVYDPWILYARGLITAPNLVLAGIVGSGKSCLAKSLYTRSIPFGRRVYVPGDPKGEHTAVAEAVGGTRHRAGPRHAQPAQPSRRGPPPLRLRRRAVGQPDRHPVAATSSERSPRPCSNAASRRSSTPPSTSPSTAPSAVPTYPSSRWSSTGSSPPTQPTIPTAGSPRTGVSSATPCAASSRATSPGSSTDPPRSRSTRRLPMISLDLSRVTENATLISVLMTCASAWMESALLDPAGGQRWVVYDEAWRLMSHPALLRRMDAHWRLARHYGIANMLIFHKLTDLDNVGDSRLRHARPRLVAARQRRDPDRLPPGVRPARRDLGRARAHRHRAVPHPHPRHRPGPVADQAPLLRRPAPDAPRRARALRHHRTHDRRASVMTTQVRGRATREAKLEALQEQLSESVAALVTGEDWKRALTFAAQFRGAQLQQHDADRGQHFAAYNEGRVPEPTPTYVAGFHQWLSLGRTS